MSPATSSLMPLLSQSAYWLIVAGLVFSCLTDLRYRIVCNEACLAVLLAAGILAVDHGLPSSIGWMAYGAMFVTVLSMSLAGMMGGGDTKLIFALLPSLTAWGCLQFAVVMCLVGGVIGLIVLALSRILRRHDAAASAPRVLVGGRHGPFSRWLRHERARLRRGRSIPYVPAIAIGWLAATQS